MSVGKQVGYCQQYESVSGGDEDTDCNIKSSQVVLAIMYYLFHVEAGHSATHTHICY